MRVQAAPGLARGAVAAEQRDRLQARDALGVGVAADQDLTAPQATIITGADSIEDQTDVRRGIARDAVLAEARCEVSVVVRDLDHGEPGVLRAPTPVRARAGLGVVVDRHHRRPVIEQR